MTKVPYRTNGKLANPTDPQSFTDFDEVCAVQDSYDGIGIGIFGDNGTVKECLEKVNLSELLTDEAEAFEALFFEKGRNLVLSIQPDISVRGSDQHLRQLLGILLDNALKYSTLDGDITVSLSRHAGHCTLSVANPGAEISQEDLRNIFKRFYRVDQARKLNGSYGLGLSIAQSIVGIHKGKIWAQSQRGINTFNVQLPVIS